MNIWKQHSEARTLTACCTKPFISPSPAPNIHSATVQFISDYFSISRGVDNAQHWFEQQHRQQQQERNYFLEGYYSQFSAETLSCEGKNTGTSEEHPANQVRRNAGIESETLFWPKIFLASYSGAFTFQKTNCIRDVTFLTSYTAYSMHKPVRWRVKRNRVRVGTIDSLWQINLSDLSSLSKFNDNSRYLLFCIDVFSKILWVVPLIKKSVTLSDWQKRSLRTI